MNNQDLSSTQSIQQAAYNIMRILLGALFAFSGFVKCVDPTGGAIKIEDYFVAWGFDAPMWLCMSLSIIQNILEFATGIMLIWGAFLRISSFVALAFMAFFTPLTLYIALAEPVSDCGCFGDAIKLTNWQTFGKNLIFLPMAVLVFWWSKKCAPHVKMRTQLAMTTAGAMIGILLCVKGLSDEPMIDFRHYSVGTNIRQAMSVPEGAPMTEYKTTFIMEKDGVRKEFDEFNYPYNDSTWVFIDSKSEVIKEGYLPPISDFTFTDTDGNEITDYILDSTTPVFMAISPRLNDISDEHAEKLGKMSDMAHENGIDFFACTASADNLFASTNEKAHTVLDYLQADETMLKTITRSNPGLIVIQNGTIVAKYHIDHAPTDMSLMTPAPTFLSRLSTSHGWIQTLCLGLVLVVVWLLVRGKRAKHEEI